MSCSSCADGPRWDAVFGGTSLRDHGTTSRSTSIRPSSTSTPSTSNPITKLRAWDSGRVTGPKGANLGELRFAFGDTVPTGFVIPFGAFRRVLDQPFEPGGPSTWNWMKGRYAADRARAEATRRSGSPRRPSTSCGTGSSTSIRVPPSRCSCARISNRISDRSTAAASSCAATPTSKTCPASRARVSTRRSRTSSATTPSCRRSATSGRRRSPSAPTPGARRT